jgi:hypothetical protein
MMIFSPEKNAGDALAPCSYIHCSSVSYLHFVGSDLRARGEAQCVAVGNVNLTNFISERGFPARKILFENNF